MFVLNLQTKIILLVCGVVALALLVTNLMISRSVAMSTQEALAGKTMDIAKIVARSPEVIAGLSGNQDLDEYLQTYANEIRATTNVEFITIIDMAGMRKSHPDPEKVGLHFVGGDEGAVLQGKEYVSTGIGTLGPSLRAFTPVMGPDGRQVGAVAVGILLNTIEQAVAQNRVIIYVNAGFGMMIGIVGAVLLAQNVKKTLFGLEPPVIAKLLEERSAMLQSVREGILAIDRETRITLVNDEAVRLLNMAGIDGELTGCCVNESIPNTRLNEILETGQAEYDKEQDLNGVVLLTNRVPVIVNGEIVGAIATFRDKTEIRQLAEQLTGARDYAEALRAQTHEFMNKLHVILGMVRMECYDQLGEYVNCLAREQQAEVNFYGSRIKDPVLAGFMLGKLSQARENGIELVLSPESYVLEPADPAIYGELVTVVGNLIDNAMDAVKKSPVKRVSVDFKYNDGLLCICVADTGPGIEPQLQDRIFQKGYSTKADNRGFGLHLLERSLARLNGKIELKSKPGEGALFTVFLPYPSKEGAE